MTATIECAVCGRKIFFDCRTPICPEADGWEEMPVCDASITARMDGRTEKAPVCPECLKFHVKIMEAVAKDYDPMQRWRAKY